MAFTSVDNPGVATIPNFLRARSANGLRRLMRMNNIRNRGFVHYEITWVESEKQWYAWYYVDELKMKDRGGENTDGESS